MSIFPKPSYLRAILLTVALVAWNSRAGLAQHNVIPTSGFVQTSWGGESGFTGGRVYAICQSSDGYLWIGAERGLFRFDGSVFTQVDPLATSGGRLGAVRGLREDVDGNLWVRLDGPRILRYHGGTFEDASAKFGLIDVAFTAMNLNALGRALLWGPQSKTISYKQGAFQREFTPDHIDGIVVSLLSTKPENLWLGTRDAGLFRSDQNGTVKVLPESLLRSVNDLEATEDAGLWLGAETGLYRYKDGAVRRIPLPASGGNPQIFSLSLGQDRDLWVGAESGLYRVDRTGGAADLILSPGDGGISAVYVDRDGDLWFATSGDIHRYRRAFFHSVTARVRRDLGGGPLLVDHLGHVWVAPAAGGLVSIDGDVVRDVKAADLTGDTIYSLDQCGDSLWLARQKHGLTRLVKRGSAWSAVSYTQKEGLAQDSVYAVTCAHDGKVWAGTVSGGISVLDDGRFTTWTSDNGLPSNAMFSSLETRDHAIWFASAAGLLRFDGRSWTSFGASENEPIPSVRTIFEDAQGVLWLGTSHGIGLLSRERIELFRNVPPSLKEEVLNIRQDGKGELWVVTSQRLLRVSRAKLLSGSLAADDITSFGPEDGLPNSSITRREKSLAFDPSGKVWVSLAHSVAYASFEFAPAYAKPNNSRIDSVSVDGTPLSRSNAENISASVHTVTFRYSGQDLSFPQRTRFRYRLDGVDRDWSRDASLRQVSYTHLQPGTYTFRVSASDVLGDWTGSESTFRFQVTPTFWQRKTTHVFLLWFLLIAAFLFYRARLKVVTERLDSRFRDRLAERTRIAQDLHDTLLQGVISASMQLDIVQVRMPLEQSDKGNLLRVLQLLRQVTEEGRDALRGLRSLDTSGTLESRLDDLIRQHLTCERGPSFGIQVRGMPRTLRPGVMEDLLRIAVEACSNAKKHSSAKSATVILDYGVRAFRLSVLDDGQGMPLDILQSGREGHWGLLGMRERASTIGGVLTIRIRPSGGTQVEVNVPSGLAYVGKRWSIGEGSRLGKRDGGRIAS